MTESDLDEVAFLTGVGNNTATPHSARNGVAVCSQKRALCVAVIVLGTLFATSLVIAFAGPQNDCGCAGKMPPGFYGDGPNDNEPFNPIATNGDPFPWLLPNLPTNIKPVRYILTIHPNLTNLDVKGQVTIDFVIEKETNFIVLNIQDLNITEKAIITPKGYALRIVKMLEYPPRQQLYLEIKDKFRKKVNYTLNLRWYSKLSPNPEGFYVDSYEDENGFQKYLAATIFKPNGARKAFPCFDEPHLRAPFRISVFRDRFHIGLSNSIVHATDDVGFYMGTGLLRDDFYETPPLPPDSIAWVVSDFERSTLEASPAYQIVTTAAPVKEKTTTTLKPEKSLIKSKTVLLTKSLNLFGSFGNHSNGDTNHHATNGNGKQHKNGNGGSNGGGNGGEAEEPASLAPSYTFYSSKESIERGKQILLTTRRVLEFFQTWLGVQYPLSKLDVIALPAMSEDVTSSLGIITIRTSFLPDQETLRTDEYHTAIIKIAEAVIKQYFGGLISPKQWRYEWLWDGITQYLGRLVLTLLEPQWPVDELQLLQYTIQALNIDAVQQRETILESSITKDDTFHVDKTVAILSMLHATLGDESFRGCLKAFITGRKYQTGEPGDLYSACNRQINDTRNIRELLDLWTKQPGYPLLTVIKNGTTVEIFQRPFEMAEFRAISDDSLFPNFTTTTYIPPLSKPSHNATRKHHWVFPVKYVTNVPSISGLIWMQSENVTINLDNEVKWIKFNAEQMGYYRVQYEEANWNRIVEQLKSNHEQFSVKDRMGLITDAFALCQANVLQCRVTINLISYLPKEQSWGPMTTGLKHLEQWRRTLKYSECYLMLSEFVRTILAKAAYGLGWNNLGNDTVKLLRSEVLLASVLWEDSSAIKQAKNKLSAFLNSTAMVSANLREVVYTGSVLSGELLLWSYCWDRFNDLRSSNLGYVERMELLRALGETKDSWLQNRLLSHVISLPPDELVEILESIAGTPTGGAMACRFLQAKWNELQMKLGAGTVQFARVITAITQYGATKFDYDELKSLVERFGRGPGVRILNMTLRRVAANVEWVSRTQLEFSNWLANFEHLQ